MFKESLKAPEEAKNKAIKQIDCIAEIIAKSQGKVRDIMARFREAAKKD